MKKIVYICQTGLIDNPSSGVGKKINYQISEFKKNGYECQCLELEPYYNKSLANKMLSRMPLGHIYTWERIAKKIGEDVFCIYIRKTKIDYYFYRFVKKMKSIGKTVFLEIPSYPYYKEFSVKDYPYLFKDFLWRKKACKLCENVIIYANPIKNPFKNSIILKNGIDVASIKVKKPSYKNGTLNIIAVSSMYYWHGYDRAIKGLFNYYNSNQKSKTIINFHFVGDGPESLRYKELVKKLGLSKYVFFYGPLYGEELDKVFDKCEIGFEGFGFHRKNAFYSTSLKSLEYASKGIPFISSTPNDNFNDCDFFLLVDKGEGPINLNLVLDFYHNLINKYINEEMLIENIRKYALEKCDYSSAFKLMINKVKEIEQ